ncbi:hypothetical protein NA57DRAFT_72032 [Rhizodiscina lignyota]|uniref:Nephrocystin 3-like N-terminal domain-containing protein n=1 Tax=Rhizodiscina lignyota TaxID=1504668 RepID=A0A9P4MD29_9PEZI|nr:hypothetical protein NA57DRAFT_72032 [Rhizodiscina lignyota]
MVLDPLSAFALAGTIVQFIDFTSKVAAGTHEIYKSREGSLVKHENLKRMTADLATLSKTLRDGSSKVLGSKFTANDQSIATIAQRCEEDANLLLTELQEIQAQPQLRILRSFQKAVRATFKQAKIQECRRRLNEYRSQLGLNLVASTREQNSSIVSILKELRDLASKNESRNLAQDGKIDRLQEKLESVMEISSTGITKSSLVKLEPKISSIATDMTTLWLQSKFLANLRFRELPVRQSNIAKAHAKTFEWIVSSESLFTKWLRSREPDDGIFWIGGKAGSGKSTLMKFVCDHPATRANLKEWAAPYQPVVAKFFFWNAGMAMQKSQEGLMRTLLVEVLEAYPEAAEKLFPDRCGAAIDDQWTRDELFAGLERLADGLGQASTMRFGFFIDGLDEYDGNHRDLLDVLKSLSSIACIKFCVSSRPWPIFEREFDRNKNRRLYLQDLTREDIALYVRSTIGADVSFVHKQSEEKGYEELISKIVQDAKGVFLWVYLVVRSLLEGLSNEDTITVLRKRLDALSKTLEGYFHLMLRSVEPVYIHRDETKSGPGSRVCELVFMLEPRAC